MLWSCDQDTRLLSILWWCPLPTLWAKHHFNLDFTCPSVAPFPMWSPQIMLVPQICPVLSGSQPWLTLIFLPFILAWWNPAISTPKSFTSNSPKWDIVLFPDSPDILWDLQYDFYYRHSCVSHKSLSFLRSGMEPNSPVSFWALSIWGLGYWDLEQTVLI